MDCLIPYGSDKIKITLSSLCVGDIFEYNEPKELKNPFREFLSVLDNPPDSSALRDIIESKHGNVVIVVDDYTRKFPYKPFLEQLTNYLVDLGVNSKNIAVLIACGTHKPPNMDQIIDLLGYKIVEQYRIKISSQETSNYKLLGYTKRKTPVMIDKEYMAADVKILLTDITIHYFAGYGGGRKSIFPGLSGQTSINANHKMTTCAGTGPGLLGGNHIHEDCLEAANFAGADFTINFCFNGQNKPFFISGGDMHSSFMNAVAEYEKFYVFQPEIKADVLILSVGGYPYDINYYQTMKALHHCTPAVKEGGKIFLFAECRDGIGNSIYERWIRKYGSKHAVRNQIADNFQQGGNSAYFQHDFTDRFKIHCFSELNDDFVNKFLHMQPFHHVGFLEKEIQLNDIVQIIGMGSKIAFKK